MDDKGTANVLNWKRDAETRASKNHTLTETVTFTHRPVLSYLLRTQRFKLSFSLQNVLCSLAHAVFALCRENGETLRTTYQRVGAVLWLAMRQL